jgi:hypothetical protein
MAVAEQLPYSLKDRAEGTTRIEEVRVEMREDSSDRMALFVVLVLSDPPPGRETWPVEDLWALRRAVRQAISETEPELSLPWFVIFEPETTESLDLGDINEQLDVDA